MRPARQTQREYAEDACAVADMLPPSLRRFPVRSAIALLMMCVPFRVLLTSVLPSLDAKLMVLCESNLSSATKLLFGSSSICFCLVLALGGVLHAPKMGFVAVGASLGALLLTHWLVTPFYFHASMQLQIEAKELLSKYPTAKKAKHPRRTRDLVRQFTGDSIGGHSKSSKDSRSGRRSGRSRSSSAA